MSEPNDKANASQVKVTAPGGVSVTYSGRIGAIAWLLIGAFLGIIVFGFLAFWAYASLPSIVLDPLTTKLAPTFAAQQTLTPMPPVVSLLSVSYMVDGTHPLRIDLATAPESGIPVSPQQSLQLFDFVAWSPEALSDCGIQVEIYAGNEFLGNTAFQPFNAGLLKWDVVSQIKAYSSSSSPNTWTVQSNWTDLQLKLAPYCNQRQVQPSLLSIRLSPNGTSWFLPPSNLSIASVVYSVNNGQPLVLDMRTTDKLSLQAKSGDTLSIVEVWYNSNAPSNYYTFIVEGDVQNDNFVPSTYKHSLPNTILGGINKVAAYTPFTWVLPTDLHYLDLSLSRNDRSVVDDILIRLDPNGSPGLVTPTSK